MKTILSAFAILSITCGSAFATTDLTLCNGQYMVSAFSEAQPQVNTQVLEGIAAGVLNLKTYNSKVGPYAVYGLEAARADRAKDAYHLMESLKQVQGAVVECNSGLVLN